MLNRFTACLASGGLLFAGLLSTGFVGRAQEREKADESAQSDDFPPGAHGGTHPKGYGSHLNTGPSNLIDHGGLLLLPPTGFHFVWWGDQSKLTPEQTILQNLVSGLGNTSLFQMMDQYTRTPDGVVGLSYPGVDYTDPSAPPNHGPSVSAIVGEVCKVLTASGDSPNSFDIYAVLTSNFPKGANYCAWHSSGSCNQVLIQVIYQPNPAGVSGCRSGVYPNNSQQADSTANTLSHEIFETVNDPRGNAWYDRNGEEIADKCAWTFSPATQNNITYTNTVGSLNYYIQQEWSNNVSGCVQRP